MISDTSPTLCNPHWASQKELLVKPLWVFPGCQEERQMRRVAPEGTVTAGSHSSALGPHCWELPVGLIWPRLLSVPEKVVLKIARTTEHCRWYQCQNRNLPERKVGLFHTAIHRAKVAKKQNEKPSVVFLLEEPGLPSCVQDRKGLSK